MRLNDSCLKILYSYSKKHMTYIYNYEGSWNNDSGYTLADTPDLEQLKVTSNFVYVSNSAFCCSHHTEHAINPVTIEQTSEAVA